MLNRLMQKTDGGGSLNGFAQGDAGTYRVRNCQSEHRSSSSVCVACVGSSLMRLQVARSMSSHVSIAEDASRMEERKLFRVTMRIASLNWLARRAVSLSSFLKDSLSPESTVDNTAPWIASTNIVEASTSHLTFLLKSALAELMRRATLRLRFQLTAALGINTDGALNIATSWSRSWVGRCTSGNPFTIETETGNITTQPISNCGLRHNRPAFGWRMWLKSMGRNWWPLDSAFVNSKHNFQTALSSLHASLGVGLSGLTCREV